jgi:hypothetical protein
VGHRQERCPFDDTVLIDRRVMGAPDDGQVRWCERCDRAWSASGGRYLGRVEEDPARIVPDPLWRSLRRRWGYDLARARRPSRP